MRNFVGKISQWVQQNRTTALAIAGVVAAALIAGLAWVVLGGETADTPPETIPTQQPAPGQSQTPGEVEAVDPGPSELPEVDVAPQIAKWEIKKLSPIPTTTDPIEFAAAFAKIWAAPNFAAYDGAKFTDWVFDHFSNNDSSMELTYQAERSIRDQITSLHDWTRLAAEKNDQAAQILSVEIPEWVNTRKPQSFLNESERSGWPNTSLVEVYSVVYTKGLIDGKTPYDYSDLHRDLFAIKCDPHCGIADVLTPGLARLDALQYAKEIDDFDLASENVW